MKTLIIAEKPSVAKDIASVLGVPRVASGYENADLIISNCVGHLVEVFCAAAESKSAPLPILGPFSLRATADGMSQFKVVKALMHRKDVGAVVNACDAGREGEAIFRLVYELAGCTKPMFRMWLQSMTNAGIKTAWTDRQPGAKFDNLAAASRSRAEADWLVGINGSRTMHQAVGRVMTPTLALVVDRYLANTTFVPKTYYEVQGVFGLAAGDYKAKWVPADDRKQIEDLATIQAIVDKCKGVAPSSVKDVASPSKEAAPFLFDLTSLQREANKVLKFSAQKTLTIAQALYEKHKATSYPRTDSNRLPEDYVGKCEAILSCLEKLPGFDTLAKKPRTNGWVKPNKRIFDNSKISDHFAIIPTGTIPRGLSADEEKIYDMVLRRFVGIFYPDAEYAGTIRTTVVAGETFRTSGRVLVKQGWLEVAKVGSGKEKEATPALPLLATGELAKNKKIEVLTQQTKPPALFTEATLLTAMESAGKALDDDELADAMKERGLGTPATRAATIEKLLKAGKTGSYMDRKGTALVPTEKGLALIAHLKKAAPKLVSPVLTGEWEFNLLQMEKGSFPRPKFMAEVEGFTRELVSTGGAGAPVVAKTPKGGKKVVIDGVSEGDHCPKCKKGLMQLRTCGPSTKTPGKKFLSCSNYFATGADKCSHSIWPK